MKRDEANPNLGLQASDLTSAEQAEREQRLRSDSDAAEEHSFGLSLFERMEGLEDPPPLATPQEVRARAGPRRWWHGGAVGVALMAAAAFLVVNLGDQPSVRDRGISAAPATVVLEAMGKDVDGGMRPLGDAAQVGAEEQVLFLVTTDSAGQLELFEDGRRIHPSDTSSWSVPAGRHSPGGDQVLGYETDAGPRPASIHRLLLPERRVGVCGESVDLALVCSPMSRLGLVWLLIVAACGPRQRPKGFSDSGTTAVELQRALEPRRFALVIGIDTYEDPAFTPLKHAQRDATSMGNVLALSDTGGFDEVIRLVGPALATRDRIFEELRALRAELRRQDSVLVYFSGHGTRQLVENAWHRYLLPHDARVADLGRTAIDLGDLQAFLRTLAAQRVGLVVDACFHGDGKSVGGRAVRPGEIEPPGLSPSTTSLQSGEAYLFATTSGRPAREDDRLGHGVYTYFLLEAMRWGFADADADHDGVLTPWEAHDYARARTLAATDGVQVPEAAIRTVGEGDLVLAGSARRRQDVERSLVYLYDGRAGLDGARIFVEGRERGTFPGTLVVQPAPQHVVVRRADGTVVVDGDVSFKAGTAYRVEDLVRLTSGPARTVGARGVLWQAPALREVGAGTLGVEAYAQWRAQRTPLRGLFGELAVGLGTSPSRVPAEGRVRDARPAITSSVVAGFQRDIRRVRLRGSWALAGRVLPPDALDVATSALSEVGFWHLATGPGLGVGHAHGRSSFMLEARALGSSLDLDGAGPRLVPMAWIGLGVETSPR